jgi:hypothetical protein
VGRVIGHGSTNAVLHHFWYAIRVWHNLYNQHTIDTSASSTTQARGITDTTCGLVDANASYSAPLSAAASATGVAGVVCVTSDMSGAIAVFVKDDAGGALGSDV